MAGRCVKLLMCKPRMSGWSFEELLSSGSDARRSEIIDVLSLMTLGVIVQDRNDICPY